MKQADNFRGAHGSIGEPLPVHWIFDCSLSSVLCPLTPESLPLNDPMHFQFEVAQPTKPGSAGGPPADPTELLRQLVEVQREQLALMRAVHDAGARWRAVLSRWQGDFPGLPDACKHSLPLLERAYIDLVAELTDTLRDRGSDPLANEFALAEFLDRYGVRLGQLATLLNVVGPIAEVASQMTDK